MVNLIKFLAQNEVDFVTDTPPIPAKNCIPKWYKEIPQTITSSLNGTQSFGRANSTIKKCMPFLDSLTTGYMFCTPFDIGIELNNGIQTSYWKVEREQVALDYDEPSRTEGLPIPSGYGRFFWRMSVFPSVSTPPGYSLLITHPLNRYDLPFLVLSGIIETDSFNSPAIITMLIKEDFFGVIPKGTPIAQIFPFKREIWKSSWELQPELDKKKAQFGLLSILERSYQSQYWSKKTYE